MIFFSPFERRFHLFVNLQPVLDEPKNAHAARFHWYARDGTDYLDSVSWEMNAALAATAPLR